MEATRTEYEQNPQAPRSYTWETPEAPVSIHVSFDVVDRLLAAVLKGFASVPRRGAEVGGILLGSIDMTGEHRVVRIEDYEPVRCEYGNGPSYLLSERDVHRFEEALQKWGPGGDRRLYAVGFYRSHTRDGLGMTDEDVRMFAKYFPAPAAVVFLVKPFATRVSTGAFFFREESGQRTESSYKEFPFRRKELGGGPAPGDRLRASQQLEDAPPSPGSMPGPAAEGEAPRLDFGPISREPVVPRGGPGISRSAADTHRKGWVWIPLSFIFLFLGVLLGFQAAISMRPKNPALTPEAFTLSLTAVKSGDSLEIRWDKNAPAIRNATRGQLAIRDGSSFNKTIELDQSQLGAGKVIYRRPPDSVQFRLEVFPKEHSSVVESFEYRDSGK